MTTSVTKLKNRTKNTTLMIVMKKRNRRLARKGNISKTSLSLKKSLRDLSLESLSRKYLTYTKTSRIAWTKQLSIFHAKSKSRPLSKLLKIERPSWICNMTGYTLSIKP